MPATLLLADDNATIQRLIELTFAEQAIKVVTVVDGQQAIDRLTAERPDIVLASASLPKISGYDVAAFVQTAPALRGVPVLLLAGAFDSLDTARVRECGAAGVLIKPFEPPVLINRVKELLGLAKSPEPAVRLRPLPGETPPAATVPAPVANTGPANPPRHPPPVLRDMEPAATRTPWEQLQRDTGLQSQQASVEGQRSGGADYFEQLDAAFASLDAQLAGSPAGSRPVPASAAPNVPPPPGAAGPAPFDPDATVRGMSPLTDDVPTSLGAEVAAFDPFETVAATAPAAPAPRPAPSAPVAPVAPVADVAPLAPVAPVAPVASASARTESRASFGETPPKPLRGEGGPDSMADIFDALFAAEQGEVIAAPEPTPPALPQPPPQSEMSDEVIDRIATRVVDKLLSGPMRDTVARVVTDVSERLVRDEIARLKGRK